MTHGDAKEMLMTPEVKAEYDKLQKKYDEIRKQLTNSSPWHTGTPTEEGRYLIENIDGYNEVLEWYNGHWYEEDPNSVDCRCKVSDSWVVAWLGQKIEPYKEDNYGR